MLTEGGADVTVVAASPQIVMSIGGTDSAIIQQNAGYVRILMQGFLIIVFGASTPTTLHVSSSFNEVGTDQTIVVPSFLFTALATLVLPFCIFTNSYKNGAVSPGVTPAIVMTTTGQNVTVKLGCSAVAQFIDGSA